MDELPESDAKKNTSALSINEYALSSNTFLSYKDAGGVEKKVKIIRVEKQGNTPSPRVICTPANMSHDLRTSANASVTREELSNIIDLLNSKSKKRTEKEEMRSPERNLQLAKLDDRLMSMLDEGQEANCSAGKDVVSMPSTSTAQESIEMNIVVPALECKASITKETNEMDSSGGKNTRGILTRKDMKFAGSCPPLTFSRVGVKRQLSPCHMCGSLILEKTSMVKLELQQPLPLSALHPSSLLSELGMSCPLPRGSTVELCNSCNNLLMEADSSYKKLQVVIERMRVAWPSYVIETSQPDVFHPQETTIESIDTVANLTPQCISVARKYVPILPKTEKRTEEPPRASNLPKHKIRKVNVKKENPLEEQNKTCICGFCGINFHSEQDWSLHMSAIHQVQSVWLLHSLQTTLKKHIGQELERPDPAPHLPQANIHNLRKCSACGKQMYQRLKLVQHLRGYHNMVVDEEFLASISGTESESPPSLELQSNPVAPVHIKTEVIWNHDLQNQEDQILEPENESWQQEDNLSESDNCNKEQQEHENNENEDLDGDGKTVNAEEEVTSHKTIFKKLSADEETSGTSLKSPGDCQISQRQARWWCRACGAPFATLGKLHRHKQQEHPGMLRLTSKTPKRDRTKETTIGGIRKPPAAKSPEEDEEDTEIHNCEACGVSVKGKGKLRKHMLASHEGSVVILEGDGHGGIINHRLNLTTEHEENPKQEKKLGKLSCRACGSTFSNLTSLAQHQHEQHKDLVDESGGAVGSGGVMMVECEVCGRRIHGLSALRMHMTRSHNWPRQEVRPQRCKMCLFQTRTRHQLDQHMRLKHSMKVVSQVECKFCGKSLSAGYLERHIANMHENKKKFSCEFCGMKFNSRTFLKSHIYFEHANMSWKCEACQLSFTKYHRLRQHNYYVHSTKVHTCNHCGKAFKRKSDHTEHIKRKHTERVPLHCPKCPNKYMDRKKLRAHLMKKHDVPWEDTISSRFARLQRENQCYRGRPRETLEGMADPTSSTDPVETDNIPEELKAQSDDQEGKERGLVEEDGGYNIVEVTETPGDLHSMGDISYIILQAGDHLQDARGCDVSS